MSWSSLLLAVYLVLVGLAAFVGLPSIVTTIAGVCALVSGVLMFLKK